MVVLEQNNGMFLCATSDKKLIYFIGNYLVSIDDYVLNIITDEELYYIVVFEEQYEQALNTLWTFFSHNNINSLRYLDNKLSLSKWYFLSISLNNIFWFDVNCNCCSLEERIVAKFKSDRKLYDCHGKFNDELKNYLNDLSVYLISCDIFTDYRLLRCENSENDLLFYVHSTCQEDCLEALVDFIHEFGLGPFTDIEFYDEIGRRIDESKIMKKKL